MFLQHKRSGCLVEILNPERLYDPCHKEIIGRSHAGQEMQEIESFQKAEMVFPSSESLPRCWLEPKYRLQVA